MSKKTIQSSRAPDIPFLVGQLHAKDSPLSRKYERFYIGHLQRWPLWLRSRFPIPRENDAESRRAQAVMALGWLGPAAKPAISDLVNALSDNSPFVASSAAHVLSGLGPSTRDALPAIVTHLRVRDSFAAANVAELIVKIAGESPDTVSSLTPMLREPDEIKTRVLRLLPKLGRPAVAASSQIEPLMDSTNVSVRFAAIAALWDLVPARQFELLPKLEEFATSPNQNIRVETGR